MTAATLNCPTCGAAALPGATQCAYCRARLATVACPSCLGMVFVGSRHCAHCGARVERAESQPAEARRCPRNCGAMPRVTVGGVDLDECAWCGGVWVGEAAFRELCADRERQAAYLDATGLKSSVPGTGYRVPGTDGKLPTAERSGTPAGSPRVRYVACPECKKVMNRMNFARVSGIVVDVCKWHGVWLDEDELRRVVEFIRGGGFDLARAKEREALREERRRLEHLRQLHHKETVGSAYPDGGGRRDETYPSPLSVLLEMFTT